MAKKAKKKVCLYALLKVEKTATATEIRKAYYARARVPSAPPCRGQRTKRNVGPREEGPPRQAAGRRGGGGGLPRAEEGARAASRPPFPAGAATGLSDAPSQAYDVLSDAGRRARYDRAGRVGDDDEGFDFEAAYERYRGVEITEEDIEAFQSGYHESAAERADVLRYVEVHDGDVSRILESIIGSTDDDAERFVAIVAGAFRTKELPKRFERGFEASRGGILSVAELESEAVDLDSDDDEEEEEDEDEDEDEDEEEDDEEDDEAKIDLEDSEEEEDARPTPSKRRAAPPPKAKAKRSKASDEPPSDLLAMFAARRQERQDGFDAFAARWEEKSKREEKQRGKGGKKKKDYAW